MVAGWAFSKPACRTTEHNSSFVRFCKAILAHTAQRLARPCTFFGSGKKPQAIHPSYGASTSLGKSTSEDGWVREKWRGNGGWGGKMKKVGGGGPEGGGEMGKRGGDRDGTCVRRSAVLLACKTPNHLWNGLPHAHTHINRHTPSHTHTHTHASLSFSTQFWKIAPQVYFHIFTVENHRHTTHIDSYTLYTHTDTHTHTHTHTHTQTNCILTHLIYTNTHTHTRTHKHL